MSPVARYMFQPSGEGYLLPDLYSAESRRHPHKEEKMAAIHEALAKCSAENPVFYEDEWIFISTRKSVLTGSYAGSKSALSHRARMKTIILPVHCTAVRVKSAILVGTVNLYHYLSGS